MGREAAILEGICEVRAVDVIVVNCSDENGKIVVPILNKISDRLPSSHDIVTNQWCVFEYLLDTLFDGFVSTPSSPCLLNDVRVASRRKEEADQKK